MNIYLSGEQGDYSLPEKNLDDAYIMLSFFENMDSVEDRLFDLYKQRMADKGIKVYRKRKKKKKKKVPSTNWLAWKQDVIVRKHMIEGNTIGRTTYILNTNKRSKNESPITNDATKSQVGKLLWNGYWVHDNNGSGKLIWTRYGYKYKTLSENRKGRPYTISELLHIFEVYMPDMIYDWISDKSNKNGGCWLLRKTRKKSKYKKPTPPIEYTARMYGRDPCEIEKLLKQERENRQEIGFF